MKKLIWEMCFVFFLLPLLAHAEDPCGNFKSEVPKEWVQGTVMVPEIPGKENGASIKIYYYGNVRPNSTPVVFFNGGPASASHDAFYNLSKVKKVFDPKDVLSFVFIDQRGNGCSDFYPQGGNEDVLTRLLYYGSRGIVADAEIIRKKLIGDKPWIVFGQSYGALIAHRYLIEAPEGVKAVFAHGNAIHTDPIKRFKQRINSQVRVMKEYLRQYPSDEDPVKVLNQKLTLNHCFSYGIINVDTACGYEVTEDMVSSFLGNSGNWPKLHQWLNLMVSGDELDLEGIAFYVKTQFVEQDPKFSKVWSNRVLSWIDRNVSPYDSRHCQMAQYDLFLEQDINIENYGFTECSSILQDPEVPMDSKGRRLVKFLPQDLFTNADFKKALLANPQKNFYLYSGQKDPFVPVESYREELDSVQGVPNVKYHHFLGTGHEGYMAEALLWKELIKEASGNMP